MRRPKRRADALDLPSAAVLKGEARPGRDPGLRLSGLGCLATSWFDSTCIARHLGGAVVLGGNEPGDNLERPEIALTWFELAELLLDQYSQERAEALECPNRGTEQ